MNAGVRLALYGVGLVAAFGAAFGIASVVVPESLVTDWVAGSDDSAAAGEHDTSAPAGEEQTPSTEAHDR